MVHVASHQSVERPQQEVWLYLRQMELWKGLDSFDLLLLTISCFIKIQLGFTFLVPAHPGSPGKRAIKRVCVCVCVVCMCVCVCVCDLLQLVYPKLSGCVVFAERVLMSWPRLSIMSQ